MFDDGTVLYKSSGINFSPVSGDLEVQDSV